MNKKQFNKLLKKIATNNFSNDKLDLSRESIYDNPDCDRDTPRLTDVEAIQLASVLKQNLYINKLDLSFNEIGDDGAKALSKVLTLEELNFTGNKVTVVGAEALGKSILIKKLSLSGNPIYYKVSDHIKFQSMIKSFCNNTTITDLNLSCTIIPGEMIAQLINKNHIIKVLRLPLYVTDIALKTIENNITLEALTIDENNITDQGAYYLSTNKNLITLSIDRSNIGNWGAKVLSAHPTLQKLKLRDSDIGIEGTKYFYSTNIAEVTLFNGTKHKFLSYEDTEQFKINFWHSKHYKQKLFNELLEEQEINLSTMDENTSYLMGDIQNEE